MRYQIHTNSNCNLDCSYCWLHNNKNRDKNDEQSIKNFLAIFLKRDIELGKVNEQSEVAIEFIGGEPFIYIDLLFNITEFFFKLCKLSNIKKTPKIYIITNGTLLNRKKVIEYIEKYKDSIYLGISIDGIEKNHNKNRFYKISKEGTYKDIVNNLQNVFTILDKSKIWCKCTFTKKTINSISKSIINIIQLGFIDIYFNFIFEDKLTKKDGIKISCQLLELYKYLIENNLYNKIKIDPFYFHDKNFLMNFYQKIQHKHVMKSNACSSCNELYCIGYDNKIYGCNRFMSMNKDMEIGIIDTDFQLTNVDLLFKIRDQYKKLPLKCQNCNYNFMCNFCTALPFENNTIDIINEKLNICEWTKSIVFIRLLFIEFLKNKGELIGNN